ncbi:hypothetical protein E2562_009963 [Oryza meyeriana var. granulata]|uniref:Uncharacterized protein n=1 Tax=Oryza meyeriana var. granulata TaxID=110450 RepID=A0A6G1EI39_9ORYZ|nr:hypothetical protein E2562_009963 [Oryza meyeriana var. granulata]
MQKSQGPTTARRRPLRVLPGNRTPHPPPGSRPRKPAPPPAAACPSATPSAAVCPPPPPASATADAAALDRLLLARSDLAGLVSQIDELVCSALQCQTVSKKGKQEIEAFSSFLSDTNSSLKQWSPRLKQALQASPEKSKNVSKFSSGTCSVSATKGNDKLVCRNSSNLDEPDLIVSPSPLVSWRAGAYEKPTAPPARDSQSFIDTPYKGLEIDNLQTIKEFSDDNPIQTPSVYSKALLGTPWKGLESDNLKKGQGILDDKPIQTPAAHSRALLGTPWKGMESTNLKGRQAGETTLKRELWTRFEAVSTNELHFDSSVFQRSDGRRFIDILEEEVS